MCGNGLADGETAIVVAAHVAALGLTFYRGSAFPQDYRTDAFVAQHGSWNRTKKYGYDVVTGRASPDGKGAKITPFMTGFMNPADNSFWGRPSHLAHCFRNIAIGQRTAAGELGKYS